MTELEKAEEYAQSWTIEPIRQWIEDAFIAGSKSGYNAGVQSGIEVARNNDEPQRFSADEFAPELPIGNFSTSIDAICAENNFTVYYDYDSLDWRDDRGNAVDMKGKHWRYPKAIRLEKEKTLPDIIEAIEDRRNDIYQAEYELPKDSYFNLLDNIIKELKKISDATSK